MPANLLCCLRLLALSIVLIAFALPALAGPFEDAVSKFANDDFSDSEEAVDAIAASGNPLAYPIISALHDERLMADPDTKKVYIKQEDGKIIDAATGARVDSLPDGADPVRLNNKLRRHVEAALGGLTLLSPDRGYANSRGAIGLQVSRGSAAAGRRRRARQGDRQHGESGARRRPRGHPAVQIRRH